MSSFVSGWSISISWKVFLEAILRLLLVGVSLRNLAFKKGVTVRGTHSAVFGATCLKSERARALRHKIRRLDDKK